MLNADIYVAVETETINKSAVETRKDYQFSLAGLDKKKDKRCFSGHQGWEL
jgi:hypothetical protein